MLRRASKYIVILITIFSISCSSIEQQSIKRVKKPLTQLMHTELRFVSNMDLRVGGKTQEEVSLRLAKDEHNIFAAAYTGQVMKVSNNKIVWQVRIKNKIASGVSVNSKHVFIGLSGGVLQALNIVDGSEAWQTKLSSEILAAVLATDQLVIIHALDGSLVALSAHTGKQIWHFNTYHPELILRQASVPVMGNHLVVSGLANGKLVAINNNNGNVEWMQDISTPHGKNDLARMVDISSSPVIVNNRVYVCAYQGNMAALNLVSGEFIWNNAGSSISGLAVQDNIVYVSMANGDVTSINASTGQSIWVQDALQGRILTKPMLYKQWLVVADDDGFIHAINRKTGELVGRIAAGDGIFSDLIEHKGQLYVYLRSGTVKAFLLE